MRWCKPCPVLSDVSFSLPLVLFFLQVFIRLVSHLYPAPLSAQTLCLRPAPANRGLPAHPGAGVPWYFQRPLVFCINGLFFLPLGLWWLRVERTCWQPGGPSTPSGMGRTWSPLLTQVGQLPPGPGPWPAVPGASAACGLASLWDLYKTKQLHGSSSACCHSQRHNSLGGPPNGKTT